MFTAVSDEELGPNINNFFTTYYTDIDTLREIKHKGTVAGFGINTYSYQLNLKKNN